MMRAAQLAELTAFVVVAEERSFRRGAARLELKPSTVSHSLRSLEERLGVRLLNRTTRTVAPTEAGALLLAQLGPAFQTIGSAVEGVNAFRSRPHGTLRLNVPRLAGRMVLAPLFGAFTRAYPDVTLEITMNDGFVDIVRDGYDAGIRLGESLEQDMIAVKVAGPMRAAVVASPEYLARAPKLVTPQDLHRHTCINRRRIAGGTLYRWEFAKGSKRLTILVDGPLILDDDQLMIDAALSSVGLAYVGEPAVTDHIASGRLVRVLEDWCPPFPGFFLYYPRHRQTSASLSALVGMLRQAAKGVSETPAGTAGGRVGRLRGTRRARTR
jgi:DNA-binding transcriptional LysR family regulator